MRIVDKLSPEVKQEVIRLYAETKVSTRDICAQYNFGSSALMDIINEAGVPFRRPEQVGKIRNFDGPKKRFCHSCGSRLSPKGSKFCCECGKPLYSEKEIIVIQLEKLTGYFIALEHAKRDDYISEINTIIKEVKKLKVVEE